MQNVEEKKIRNVIDWCILGVCKVRISSKFFMQWNFMKLPKIECLKNLALYNIVCMLAIMTRV